MDAGSDSNQRVTGTPHADHGTVVGAKARTLRKGAQACCARGMCDRRARQCTMNVKGRVLWKKRAAYVFMFSISRLKSTIASAAVSRNGRTEGAGTRCGPELEPVGLGSAQQPRRMMEACSASGGRLSVQRGTRARNVVIAFVDDDSRDDLEVVLEEIGNDGCVLREETEVGVGAPFGGAQLE